MELLIELLIMLIPLLLLLAVLHHFFSKGLLIRTIMCLLIGYSFFQILLYHKKIIVITFDKGNYLLQFEYDTWLIFTLTLIILLALIGCFLFLTKLNTYVQWLKRSSFIAVSSGIVGGTLLAVAFLWWNGQLLIQNFEFIYDINFFAVLLLIIVLKTFEELLFRGYLQGVLDKRYSSKVSSIINIAVSYFLILTILIVQNMTELYMLTFVLLVIGGNTYLRNVYGVLSSAISSSMTTILIYVYTVNLYY